MSEIDLSTLNIFAAAGRTEFNAGVGTNSFHDMRTYAEGYLQAAEKLTEVMIEQRLMPQRDTLVHPILYSARHGIELSIKHVLSILHDVAIKTEERLLHGHQLGQLWPLFKEKTCFDRRVIAIVDVIDPIVIQLDQSDPDAQDFRYPINSAGEQTLEGKTIVNLAVVAKLIKVLHVNLLELMRLAERIVQERKLNAYTDSLNREELKKLSLELPDISTWAGSDEFFKVREKWKESLELSNGAFSRAVDFIKNHREFSGNIGNDHSLIALDIDFLERLFTVAYEMRKQDIADRDLDILEAVLKPSLARENYPSFKDDLSLERLAELKALYYFQDVAYMSESYEVEYECFVKELSVFEGESLENAIKEGFIHVYEKLDFIPAVLIGLKLTGQLKYYDSLSRYEVIENFDSSKLGRLVTNS